ncbi:major capsid protein [Pseudomonas sp. NCCP-436]|uniref:major capsid protein n=1 Tax=Pseudomonas sp. NCCP-436 TaxID=2842481 RepID=UPI001C7F359B|nr:major capsid protein [Pseudomonas sp. NCCP-436]GIZ13885.1 hypothetical protein NCCP436_33010 [Pseudomonas sp. NCCP-436]
MKQLKRVSRDLALALPFVAVGTSAFAWDYSTVTDGISFSTIATGVLAVAGLLAVVYAGIKGARIILGFLRS